MKFIEITSMVHLLRDSTINWVIMQPYFSVDDL